MKPKPLESYLTDKDHNVKYPKLERNSFLVFWIILLLLTGIAVYVALRQ